MKGYCPHCGGIYVLTKDGTMRKHNYFVSGGKYTTGHTFWQPCPGIGEKPSKVGK